MRANTDNDSIVSLPYGLFCWCVLLQENSVPAAFLLFYRPFTQKPARRFLAAGMTAQKGDTPWKKAGIFLFHRISSQTKN